ncbi:MAG: hypothetical protein KDK26_15735 [Roseivivax sp.]|nr:hypothetical protein [Roseivivax sp.]
MDPVSLAFYAIVCGLLSLAGPMLGSAVRRLILGAIVGVVAAAALPTIRAIWGL